MSHTALSAFHALLVGPGLLYVGLAPESILKVASNENPFGPSPRAVAAIDEGRFEDEIFPVEVTRRDGETVVFQVDEHPRRETTMEKLANLKPLHPEIDGRVDPQPEVGERGAVLVLEQAPDVVDVPGRTFGGRCLLVGEGECLGECRFLLLDRDHASGDHALEQSVFRLRYLSFGVLNFVLEDARSISRQLGKDDQIKLQEYLEAVDTMESRVRFLNQHPQHPLLKFAQSARPQRPQTPETFHQHLSVMLDLLVLAFRCDAVRTASVMLANDTSQQIFPLENGWTEPHHSVSHHQADPQKIRQYQHINRWYVQQFANLAQRLAQIREGAGTLLDSCLLLLGSGMSDGNRHAPDDLPIVLLTGRATGINGSVHKLYTDRTVPLCNLYLSILQKLGLPTTTFGDSDGTLF